MMPHAEPVPGAGHLARHADHGFGRDRRGADGKRPHRVAPANRRRILEHDVDGGWETAVEDPR